MRPMRTLPLIAVCLLLPAGLAGQTTDSTVARLQRRLAALQAQLDSLSSEVQQLALPAVATGPYMPRPRIRTANCLSHQALPDADCTPGAIMTRDLNTICHTSTQGRRDVTGAVERAAYAAYGVPYPQPKGSIELDHLVSLELGGDNTIANLWPQFASPRPGFHEKDLVENELHRRVCAGEMTLDDAQRVISTDWLAYYRTTLEHAPH